MDGHVGRAHAVDFIRSAAVVLMVAYHFVYDLGHFGFHAVDMNAVLEWKVFRYLIVSLFFLCVGISLILAHRHSFAVRRFGRRLLILTAASVAVSLASYAIFPHSWIYFGVLHFIALATVCAFPLRRFPIGSLLLAVAILILYNVGMISVHPLYSVLQQPLNLPRHTEDLIPFVPWFAVVLAGMYIGHYRLYDIAVLNCLGKNTTATLISRNALWIYLAHQPLLFGTLALITGKFR